MGSTASTDPPLPHVRLVVLNFNGGTDLGRCVGSLTGLDWPADRREIVVVDNASTDGSVERARDAYPEIAILRSPKNLGFSANNLAFRDLDDVDFVALVNPDTVVDPGWLRALVTAVGDDPSVGAAVGKMLLDVPLVWLDVDPSGDAATIVSVSDGTDRSSECRRVWRLLDVGTPVPDRPAERRFAAGSRVPLAVPSESRHVDVGVRDPAPALRHDGRRGNALGGAGLRFLLGPERTTVINNAGVELLADGYGRDRGLGLAPEQLDRPADVFAWSGGGVLLRVAFLRDVGGFDPRFFLYYEDLDLSWRGRLAGWRYRYTPDAVLHHRHGASSDASSQLFRDQNERNRLFATVKNAPPTFVARVLVTFLRSIVGHGLAAAGRRPVLSTTEHRAHLRARLRAGAALVVNLRGLLADRRVSRSRLAGRDPVRRWVD